MLDAQRYRHSPKLDHLQFTRRILWVDLALLILVGGLLTFHGLFFYALMALLTLMISLLLMVGMGNANEWCRISLAVLTFLAAGACFLLARFGADLTPNGEPALGAKLLPIWSGLAAIGSLILSFLLIFSSKIQYSSRRIFRLW